MSNTEPQPELTHCTSTPGPVLLSPREVPLGGPRAMTVRRTLPQRERSLIGGWCFIDHYGPDDVSGTGGMQVPGHPHTGLQTVSWLFSGAVDHLDTVGSRATVRPGEVNLMTAGRGIAHSEFSTADTTILHGAQLWLALPEAARRTAPAFENYRPPTIPISDLASAVVFIGDLLGSHSPVTVHSPLVGVEITITGSTTLELPVNPEFEHGVLIDTGNVAVSGRRSSGSPVSADTPESGTDIDGAAGDLVALPVGYSQIDVCTNGPARLLLLGGAPLNEEIVMWWNFIGRSHEEVVEFRTRWQQERLDNTELFDDRIRADDSTGLFGEFPDAWTNTLPAPELPGGRLRSRS